MSNFIAASPNRWRSYLEIVKDFLNNEKQSIEDIIIINRCTNCYKKNRKVKLSFKKEKLVIEDWIHQCSFGKKELKHTYIVDKCDLNQFHSTIEQDGDNFNLIIQYFSGINLTIPVLTSYSDTDFKVLNEYVYKDRNLKMIQREVNEGLVIMFQNFIDFEGLEPMFSDTVYIKWKS